MLSAVYLTGKLGPVSDNKYRQVIVQRAYKEDMKTPTVDRINVMYWSENVGALFYRFPESSLVSIKGRLEAREDRLVVVAEQVNFIK